MAEEIWYYPADESLHRYCYLKDADGKPHWARFFDKKGVHAVRFYRVAGKEYTFPGDFSECIKECIAKNSPSEIQEVTLVVSAATAVALALAGVIPGSCIERVQQDVVGHKILLRLELPAKLDDKTIKLEVYRQWRRCFARRQATHRPGCIAFDFRRYVNKFRS